MIARSFETLTPTPHGHLHLICPVTALAERHLFWFYERYPTHADIHSGPAEKVLDQSE